MWGLTLLLLLLLLPATQCTNSSHACYNGRCAERGERYAMLVAAAAAASNPVLKLTAPVASTCWTLR
jgi:hypothetical protein